jgi:hypothetical protein
MERNWLIRSMPRWEKRHAKSFAVVRLAVGVWLLVLTALLYGYHRSAWWAALLVPAAAAHFYWAYCLVRLHREQHPPGAAA